MTPARVPEQSCFLKPCNGTSRIIWDHLEVNNRGITCVKAREETANMQASPGRVVKAVVASASVVLAADTDKVQQTLRANFPEQELPVTNGGEPSRRHLGPRLRIS